MEFRQAAEERRAAIRPASGQPVDSYGAIAQLVEHLHGMQGVSGSNPLGSISKPRLALGFFDG